MRSTLLFTLLTAGTVGILACEADTGGGESAPIRPVAVDGLELSVGRSALGAAMASSSLAVAALESEQVLVGSGSGLFQLETGGRFVALDSGGVHGIAIVEGQGAAIASEQGVLFFDGTLARSPVNTLLGDVHVTAIAARGTDLLIGTTGPLFLLRESRLSAFAALDQVESIATFRGSRRVVLRKGSGATLVLDESMTTSTRDLSEEVGSAPAVPNSEGQIFALVEGALEARIELEDGHVAWRPVALTLDATEGARGVEAITVDPSTGAIWVADEHSIARLDHGRVAAMTKPAALGVVRKLFATRDGAIFAADDEALFRLAPESEPTSYAKSIAAMSRDSCERCHSSLGTAHALTTYEAWVREVDRIIAALESGRMPADGGPIVNGSVELVRKWRADGLRP